MFAAVRPKLGVIYHYRDEAGMAEAVRQEYKGEFVMGMMVIEVGAKVKVQWKRFQGFRVSRFEVSRRKG